MGKESDEPFYRSFLKVTRAEMTTLTSDDPDFRLSPFLFSGVTALTFSINRWNYHKRKQASDGERFLVALCGHDSDNRPSSLGEYL